MAERPETQEKRKVILRAATEVFGEKGATKGTLEDIAEKVGMTRAGVLHHFGSKDNLLLQTVIYRDSVDLEDYPEDMARGGRHHVPPSHQDGEGERGAPGPGQGVHCVLCGLHSRRQPGVRLLRLAVPQSAAHA